MSGFRDSRLAALKAEIAALEAGGRADSESLPFGAGTIDACLPGGGLPLGQWHELLGAGIELDLGPDMVGLQGDVQRLDHLERRPTINLGAGDSFNFTGGRLVAGVFNGTLNENGGTLAPGDAAIAPTTINGSFNLAAAGTLAIQLSTAAEDQVIVNGVVV